MNDIGRTEENLEHKIVSKVREALDVIHLDLQNESHMHSGPATDSHYKLTAVSNEFDGKMPVKRHQMIYRALSEELAGPVHALALHLYTPDEWARQAKAVPDSPDCRGGSKAG